MTFTEGFVASQELKDMTLIGNSLGGHIAILYTLTHPEQVRRLVLTGSSGLFENGMGARIQSVAVMSIFLSALRILSTTPKWPLKS